MRWIALLPALAMIAPSVSADEPLTMEAAVATAVRHNLALRAAEQTQQASAARFRQARAHRLPSVDLTESFTRTDSPAEAFALQLNQERFDMAEFSVSDPNSPDWLTTWMTRLEVRQPVYTGGLLSARIGQAEHTLAAADLARQHAREQVGFETITSFSNLTKAREYLDLLDNARQTTVEHVKLAELYAAQGLIVDAEVLKARVFLAEMEELTARARHDAYLAEAALNFHMGTDQDQHHELAPLPQPPVVEGSLEGWTERALKGRRDLMATRQQLDAGRLEERVARAAFRPELAVIGRFDLYDDGPFETHGDSAAVMAVARVNLFRGGADRAAVVAAQHDNDGFEAQLDRFEEAVRLEVRQAWQEMDNARARHEAARVALEAASEALRVREHRFRQGLDRMIDLLDAETGLRESEVRELVARHDLALASYRLHFSSGASVVDLVHPTEE